MRFGIDCDGIICDFVNAFVREVNNLHPGKLPINYVPVSWAFSEVLTRDEVNEAWKAITAKPNWWLSVPSHGENVRAIALHRIRHPEDEVFFVTARQPTGGMPVMHQTQIWLQQCGIGGLGTSVIVDNAGDKVPIFNALGCVANIDDKLEAVIEHSSRTTGAYLLDRPWNRTGRPSSISVVANLEEFFRKAGKYVTTA